MRWKLPNRERVADVVRTTAEAVMASGTALLASGQTPTFGAALAGAGAVGNALFGEAGRAYLEALPRRRKIFYEAYLQGRSVDPELDEAKLHAESSDPIVQQLVIEAARLIGEALVDAVVPAMARLTRAYAAERRPADAFFRGMRRVLTDLSEQEFRDLRALLEAAHPPVEVDNTAWLELEVEFETGATTGPAALKCSAAIPSGGQFEGRGGERVGRAPPSASRLFQLLQVNSLAQPGTARWGATLPASILIEVATLDGIRSICF
jgi:hypothetical protein